MSAKGGAEAETGARAFKTALKILCKSSLEYLGILVAVIGVSAIGGFILESPADYLDNLSPNSGGGKKSGRATEGATEGASERRSQRGRLRSWNEVILVQTFFYNILSNRLADPLGMEKLEL